MNTTGRLMKKPLTKENLPCKIFKFPLNAYIQKQSIAIGNMGCQKVLQMEERYETY
jgi:hypothetical protein